MEDAKEKEIYIDLNEDFQKAFNLMEHTSRNIFITGKAGTGKSTLLTYFRSKTKKQVIFLAPTGVSALNIKGQTIHSFFGFKPNITEDKIKKVKKDYEQFYKKIDCIIIDEISMVRCDLLDCIDKFLRINGKDKTKSFGGVQMIFIGDLYQLPPVVNNEEREIFKEKYPTPYFFSSKVFEKVEIEFVELNKIYRQTDNIFINILNMIRNNTVTDKALDILNTRHVEEIKENKDDFYIYLTTTNKKAEEVNTEKLNKIKGKEYVYKGLVKGKFDDNYIPNEKDLSLKINAQVMMLNNDSEGRWVNGSIGKIVNVIKNNDIENDSEKSKNDIVIVELENGDIVEVETYKWDIFNYQYNEEEGIIESKPLGSFTQYPLKLSWAITIHKSQGKTFEKVIIDLGASTFAHGQTYVALSRCTNLEGIILKNKVHKRHILLDYKVIDFITKFQYKKSEENFPLEEKIKLIKQAIEEKRNLEIIYLKQKDEKNKREIKPIFVGEMEYKEQKYIGIEAFCLSKNEMRIFRVDRILDIKMI